MPPVVANMLKRFQKETKIFNNVGITCWLIKQARESIVRQGQNYFNCYVNIHFVVYKIIDHF